MNVLQRASSIRGVRELSAEETRRLEADWNAVFTKIGVVQGQLKARRRELLSRSILTSSLARLFGRTGEPSVSRPPSELPSAKTFRRGSLTKSSRKNLRN